MAERRQRIRRIANETELAVEDSLSAAGVVKLALEQLAQQHEQEARRIRSLIVDEVTNWERAVEAMTGYRFGR